MAGLSEVQKIEVRALIGEVVAVSLQSASEEDKASIAQVVGREVGNMREAAQAFETRATEQRTQHAQVMNQIAGSMGSMQAMVLKLQEESGATREGLQKMLTEFDRQLVGIRE